MYSIYFALSLRGGMFRRPETVCDWSILLNIHWQIQEILIFTTYLQKNKTHDQNIPSHWTKGLSIMFHLHVILHYYRFTSEASCLVGQRALEDLMNPGGGGWGAVIVLGIKCAVGQFAILFILLSLFL